jgi:hypothetical protein
LIIPGSVLFRRIVNFLEKIHKKKIMSATKIFYNNSSINFHTSKIHFTKDFESEEKKVLTNNAYIHANVYNVLKLKDNSYENAKKRVMIELNKEFSDYDIKMVNRGISILTKTGEFNSFNFTYSVNENTMCVFVRPKFWFSDKFDKEMKEKIQEKLLEENSDPKKRKAYVRALNHDDIQDEIDDTMNLDLYEKIDIEDGYLTNYELPIDTVTKFLKCVERGRGEKIKNINCS